MNKLIGHLPDLIFSPLAGANRVIYVHVLVELHALFFEEHDSDLFPRDERVKDYIQDALDKLAQVNWEVEEEGQGLAGQQSRNSMHLANYIFNRLVACGWLEKEKDGYTTRVAMPPDVGQLLSFLVELASPDRIFYGGMVLSIYNNLMAARNNPRRFSLGVHQARADTKRFADHLGSMVYNLANLLEKIGNLQEIRDLLHNFFDDFVTQFLVADYKRLKIQNNPFHCRLDILRLLTEMETDEMLRRQLVTGYMRDQGIIERMNADIQLDKDLGYIRQVFVNIDKQLERIEIHRLRYERRAADAIRYQDRTMPGISTRLAQLIERVAKLDVPEFASHVASRALASPRPLAERGLAIPWGRRSSPPVRPLRRREINPEVLAHAAAIRSYLLRTMVDPARIAAYLERCLSGFDELPCEAFPIESVEDYIAFAHIRFLPYMGGAGKRLASQYEIRLEDREADTPWIRLPWFAVRRRPPVSGLEKSPSSPRSSHVA